MTQLKRNNNKCYVSAYIYIYIYILHFFSLHTFNIQYNQSHLKFTTMECGLIVKEFVSLHKMIDNSWMVWVIALQKMWQVHTPLFIQKKKKKRNEKSHLIFLKICEDFICHTQTLYTLTFSYMYGSSYGGTRAMSVNTNNSTGSSKQS